MRPVAYLEGVFQEIKPCSNDDYFMAKFKFPHEVFGKTFKVDDMPQPRVTSILCEPKSQEFLLSLKPDQKYRLQVSLGVSKANEKDGRSYPASLSFNILAAQPC